MQESIFTIGHSSHELEDFISLLKMHNITAVADVRSAPYSQTYARFSREVLKRALADFGIAYVFLGDELGARSEDPSCYENGKISYDRLARTELFQRGLERVMHGIKKFRVALMCAEKEPLECHRTILVAKHLVARGVIVKHILADGTLEDHSDTLMRLTRTLGLKDDHMFRSQEEMVADAYALQEEQIAYAELPPGAEYPAQAGRPHR